MMLSEIESAVRIMMVELSCNPHTQTTTLEWLAKHGNNKVRCNVVNNPNTDEKTIEFLSHDKTEKVRRNVARSVKATPKLLENMYQHTQIDRLKKDIINNPNCPNEVKVLDKL